MKKIIISAALCLGFILPSVAQEADPVLNRRGVALLPKAGDFAIGIEATPFLGYLGNMFRFSSNPVDLTSVLAGGQIDLSNQAPTFTGLNQSIYAKYFLEDNAALRIRLGFDFSTIKYKQTVRDDFRHMSEPLNPMPTTIDVLSVQNRGIDLGIGYEMRRGKGRVQGFYGAELGIHFGKRNLAYDYGNEITIANQAPTDHDFSNINASYNNKTAATGFTRNVETKGGAEFGLGLGAFVGVEYFFAPQISIGGELGLGLNYFIKGQDTKTDEGVMNNEVIKYEYRSRTAADVAYEMAFRTTPSGKIFVMFHF